MSGAGGTTHGLRPGGPAPLLPGAVVASRYRVREVLGRGSSGVVYRAEDARIGRVVALKALRADLYDRDDLVKQFEREARSAARVGHEGIVGVHAIGHDPALRTRFIVQEYLHGADVARCLGELGCVSPEAAVAIVVPVMDALVAAHRAGIVHRDVKPENVFLHELGDGRVAVRVIDFGIAKVNDELDRAERAVGGVVVGTPWYMSPEQATGSPAVDERTDVWSVGAMLYEMVCGVLPFAGSNPDAVMAQIIFGRPTPVDLHRPGVPEDLRRVIHRAIERDLDRRFGSMAEFRDALLRCELLGGGAPPDLGELFPRPSRFSPVEAPSPSVRPAPHASRVEPPKERRALPTLGLALLALGCAVPTAGLIHWVRRSTKAEPVAPHAASSPRVPAEALSASTAATGDR